MKKFSVWIVIITILLLNALPVFAQGVSISSADGDKISLFDDIEISGAMNGNVISVLGNVTVDGKIDGQVVSVFGDITVNAEITKQVVTVFGTTFLEKNAVIRGDVITIGSLHKEDGANVFGQEVRILGESMNLDIGAILYLRLAIMILFALGVLVVGLLLIGISKKRYTSMANRIDKNVGKKFFLGFLTLLATSILLLLLLLTLIAPVFYIVVLVLSSITASMFLGKVILKTFSPSTGIYMEFITGLITITLVKLVLLFMVPQSDLLLGLILATLFNLFVYSMGMGIYMEDHYLNNNK